MQRFYRGSRPDESLKWFAYRMVGVSNGSHIKCLAYQIVRPQVTFIFEMIRGATAQAMLAFYEAGMRLRISVSFSPRRRIARMALSCASETPRRTSSWSV